MKSKHLTKIDNFNIAQQGIQSLYINAPDATAEEIETLLRTADDKLIRLTFNNTALPSQWENIKSLEILNITSFSEEIPAEALFNIPIKNIKLVASKIKKIPASFFENKHLQILQINCSTALATDTQVFNLPKLEQLIIIAPKFDFSSFSDVRQCSLLQSLRIFIDQLDSIPDFFSSSVLTSAAINSKTMTQFPLSLTEVSTLNYLDISAPLNDKIQNTGFKLSTLHIRNAENISFEQNVTFPITNYLTIDSKKVENFPSLTADSTFNKFTVSNLTLNSLHKKQISELKTQNLNLDNCRNIDVDFLETLKKTKSLQVRNCELEIFDYKKLREKLDLNQLKHIEEEVYFDNIDVLLNDKKAKRYSIPAISFRGKIHLNDPTVLITKKYAAFSESDVIKPKSFDRELRKGISLFQLGREIVKAPRFKDVDRKRLFLHFWNEGAALILPDNFSDNLRLLSVNYLEIQQAVRKQIIEPLLDNAVNLSSVQHVFINGRPDMAKNELAEKIKTTDLQIHTKPAKGITHMVICDKPHFTNFAPADYVLIPEDTLRQFLNDEAPGFLTEKDSDPELIENINQFLSNTEVSNLILGLNMIQTGGLPDTLFETVLVLAKSHDEAKVRRTAAKVMKTYGPEHLVNIVKTTQTFKKKANYIPQVNRFALLEKKLTIREIFELNFILYKHGIRNLRYIFCHKNPDVETLKKVVKYVYSTTGKLDFGKAIGNSTQASSKYSARFYLHPDFPTDDYLENLSFNCCGFKKFPEEILRFKNVKKLSLSSNFIQTLPKSIQQLEALEELVLFKNRFKKYPEVLRNMPNLKNVQIEV